MREPCKRQQKAICSASNDAEADENDGDGVEGCAEKQKGLVVMKGAEHFSGCQLGVEGEHFT